MGYALITSGSGRDPCLPLREQRGSGEPETPGVKGRGRTGPEVMGPEWVGPTGVETRTEKEDRDTADGTKAKGGSGRRTRTSPPPPTTSSDHPNTREVRVGPRTSRVTLPKGILRKTWGTTPEALTSLSLMSHGWGSLNRSGPVLRGTSTEGWGRRYVCNLLFTSSH